MHNFKSWHAFARRETGVDLSQVARAARCRVDNPTRHRVVSVGKRRRPGGLHRTPVCEESGVS